MPDWKRIIVGDAFALSSRNPNYYRDLFLIAPIFLFSIAGAIHVVGPSQGERIAGLKCLAISGLAILLACERFALVLAVLAFVAVRLFGALLFHWNRSGFLVLLAAVALLILSIPWIRTHKLSYGWPDKEGIASLLVSVSSLILTLFVFQWLHLSSY